MELKYYKLTEITPYERNPRNNDEAVQYVANSIKSFGFKVPLVIDKNNVIVCGHTRYKAAEQLGLDTVPCIMADDLTDEQIAAFRLADNKTGELATWDFNLLEMEYVELQESGIELADFGFTEFQHGDFIDDLYEDEDIMNLRESLEKDTFNITFTFPVAKEQEINDYIKKKGKDYLVNKFIEHIENEEEETEDGD